MTRNRIVERRLIEGLRRATQSVDKLGVAARRQRMAVCRQCLILKPLVHETGLCLGCHVRQGGGR